MAKRMGAEEGFNTSNFSGSYNKLTDNKYDIIIDVTGVSEVVENSLDLLDTNGTFYIFGVAKSDSILKINHFSIFGKNIKISGAYPDLRSFGPIIKMIDKKILDPTLVISHRFRLDDFMEGFNLAKKQSGAVAKILIYP